MSAFLKWTKRHSSVMQLYIETYFICKIFIGESVTLRTLHKILRTLHSEFNISELQNSAILHW